MNSKTIQKPSTALSIFPVGTRVEVTVRDVTPFMTLKQRAAAPMVTRTGVVVGAYTFLGADEVMVRWDGDIKPGAEKGRRAHPAALLAVK